MVEFGEKLKKVREEQGLTQQSLAERLYVTRQAVSRWECGARYPDLLTAKKIATILNVSLDELLSGEELKQNIEREPVLAKPIENIIQTVLYAVATIVYFLLCVFSVYALLNPNVALANTPAGESALRIGDVIRIAHFIAAVTGCVLSVKNKLTAKAVGCIMCVPYAMTAISFVATYIDMQMKDNGYIGLSGWLADFTVPLLFVICILAFFGLKDQRVPMGIIIGISILTIAYLTYFYKNKFIYFTDLGFVITTIHMTGKIGMAALLGYQAFVWNKKRKIACKISTHMG